MMKFNIKTGKILLLSIVAFCFVQCNEGDGVAGSGREIAITDSLPGGTFDFAVSDITVTPGERSSSRSDLILSTCPVYSLYNHTFV